MCYQKTWVPHEFPSGPFLVFCDVLLLATLGQVVHDFQSLLEVLVVVVLEACVPGDGEVLVLVEEPVHFGFLLLI